MTASLSGASPARIAAVSSSDRPASERPARDGLGVDAGAGPRVQAREHPAVAVGVEQREREALVAAGLLERVVADQARPAGTPARWPPRGRPVRAATSSSSRATAKTLSRWASRTASRLAPSAPRVSPPAAPRADASRRSEEDDRDESTTTSDDQERRWRRVGSTSALRSIGGPPSGRPPSLAGGPVCAGAAFAWLPRGRPATAPRCRRPRRPRPPDGGPSDHGQTRPAAAPPVPASARRSSATDARAPRPPRHRDAAVAPRPASLTDEEEARAAELEAQIVAEEKAAEAARKRGDRSRAASDADEAGIGRRRAWRSRASEEYAYVGRDVKRIALIGGVADPAPARARGSSPT